MMLLLFCLDRDSVTRPPHFLFSFFVLSPFVSFCSDRALLRAAPRFSSARARGWAARRADGDSFSWRWRRRRSPPPSAGFPPRCPVCWPPPSAGRRHRRHHPTAGAVAATPTAVCQGTKIGGGGGGVQRDRPSQKKSGCRGGPPPTGSVPRGGVPRGDGGWVGGRGGSWASGRFGNSFRCRRPAFADGTCLALPGAGCTVG